mgnify:CR=1 FL=1
MVLTRPAGHEFAILSYADALEERFVYIHFLFRFFDNDRDATGSGFGRAINAVGDGNELH